MCFDDVDAIIFKGITLGLFAINVILFGCLYGKCVQNVRKYDDYDEHDYDNDGYRLMHLKKLRRLRLRKTLTKHKRTCCKCNKHKRWFRRL